MLLCCVTFTYLYANGHYAKCCYAKCNYGECHYAKCNYGECHYAECHYAKCRGANLGPIVRNNLGCSFRIKLVCLNATQITAITNTRKDLLPE